MFSHVRLRTRSHRSALFFFVFLAVGASAATAGARSMHLALTRAEPAKDTTVATAPKMLKLFFSESVKATVTAVKLTAADSSTVELGPLTLGEGKIAPVVATVKGVMKNGKHKVTWRTVGADGHALNGEYSFTVKAAAPAGGTEPNRR